MVLSSFVLMFLACAGPSDFPVLEGAYLGQTPPGDTPEIFAPDEKIKALNSSGNGNTDIYCVDAGIIETLKPERIH